MDHKIKNSFVFLASSVKFSDNKLFLCSRARNARLLPKLNDFVTYTVYNVQYFVGINVIATFPVISVTFASPYFVLTTR